ncbi:MAG TPA: alpha/beta hydrolase [Alphaproteobacteria bacterium]|nr:alpha/beta hydrolase [Alphaproteobacteria bacterium]
MTEAAPQFLTPRANVRLAYHRFEGASKTLPGVIFCGGFRSDMTGTKATCLEAHCRAHEQSFVRFDYTGHGQSSGKFEDGTIGSWFQDALDVFDTLSEGPQIVVGSSMGGWIAMLLARARKSRMAGLTLLAPAPDFTEDVYIHEFGEEERHHLASKGVIYMPSAYGEPYPLTAALFADGRNHLLLKNKIDMPFPVRMIHGKQDADVPWRKSEHIQRQLICPDARILWVEDGDHRLSRAEDITLITRTVDELSHLYRMGKTAEG